MPLSLGRGVRGEAEVGVDDLDVVAEELLDLLALDRGVDNDLVALVPVWRESVFYNTAIVRHITHWPGW
jgi:hypothetical protein